MCTKNEVRDVIRSESAPAWMRYMVGAMGAGILGLMSWLLMNSHSQDALLAELKTTTQVSTARLTGKLELVATQIVNLKELAIDRSKDRYTGTEARSRNVIMDERCRVLNMRMDSLEEDLDKNFDLHKE